jgi:hypothetical protein
MRTALVGLVLVAAGCSGPEASVPETAAAAPAPAAPAASAAPASPKAAPGLVAWRADEAAAFAAARTSGRPVLVFQMFGRLDDEFC